MDGRVRGSQPCRCSDRCYRLPTGHRRESEEGPSRASPRFTRTTPPSANNDSRETESPSTDAVDSWAAGSVRCAWSFQVARFDRCSSPSFVNRPLWWYGGRFLGGKHSTSQAAARAQTVGVPLKKRSSRSAVMRPGRPGQRRRKAAGQPGGLRQLVPCESSVVFTGWALCGVGDGGFEGETEPGLSALARGEPKSKGLFGLEILPSQAASFSLLWGEA